MLSFPVGVGEKKTILCWCATKEVASSPLGWSDGKEALSRAFYFPQDQPFVRVILRNNGCGGKGRKVQYKEYTPVKILGGKLTAVSPLKFPTLL